MPAFGVYPVADALTEGEEVSSTYEGRHVTLLESELIHKAGNVGGLVDKGNPVVFDITEGHGVGIAFTDAAAATDLVAIDTEGIWIVDVVAADDGGNIAVGGGDVLYINNVTAVVSKIATGATQVPFGYALGIIATPGNIERIAVKLHWSPVDNWIRDLEPFYFGDGLDVNLTYDSATGQLILTAPTVTHDTSGLKIVAAQAAGHNEQGIAWYADANYSGVMTATFLYGCGTWVNLATSFDGAAVRGVVAAQDNGIFATTLTECATTDLVYGMRAECITQASVHGLYAFSLNAPIATTAAHRAIFYADNVESVGHLVAQKSGVSGGCLALAYVNGSGYSDVYYVNLWQS